MASRQNVYVSLREPAKTPPSPRATVAQITVELRVFYPPGTDFDRLIEMVHHASRQAVRELQHRAEPAHTDTTGGRDE